jgi:HEPN domain-containing protein
MYLISQKQQINKTHNLKYLLKLCVRIDKDFDKLDVGDLTDYAIELRYPDNFYIPDLEETKEALEIAETIKSFVLNKLTL